jgi:unsaturated rhamnogalacturonyl hydrolase
MKLTSKPALFCIFFFVSLLSFSQTPNDTWSVKFSNALIFRYQPTVNALTAKGWEYSNTIMTHGMEKVYNQVPDSVKYRNYIKAYIDAYVNSSGVINATINSLDRAHPGISCLFLYEKTGLAQYKTAATTLRNMFVGSTATYPKTATGKIFWHKNNGTYNDMVLIDGIYMLHPFLAKYGRMFNDNAAIDTAVNQTLYVYYQLTDNAKHLIRHAWNPTKTQTWADPVTGNSSEVWSRGMGWFTMALVDILKYLPVNHPRRAELISALANLAIGIQTYQDPATGLWYQVVDKGTSLAGNFLETSGSAMFVYALKVGVDSGWISSSYLPVAQKAWNYLKNTANVKISLHTDGYAKINDFAPAMGVQTSAANYVQASLQPVDCPGTAHPHGYGAILMTASVMEFPLTADTQAPSAPVLSAADSTTSSISLSWTAATDNVGVTGYEVYVNNVLKSTTTALAYTVTGLTPSTTYSIYVKAKDAAGNGSNSATITARTITATGPVTLFTHYFETGWDGWVNGGGDDCARYTGTRSFQGVSSIYIRDNSALLSSMTSPEYNVTAYNQLVIDFYFYAASMESGEDFFVQYFNGTAWTTVGRFIVTTNFVNNSFNHATVTLTGLVFPANAKFRFQCDASDNSDLIYIDQVKVSGTVAALRGNQSFITQSCEQLSVDNAANDLQIYPNPVNNSLSVKSADIITEVKIYDVTGTMVKQFENPVLGTEMDITVLKSGVYFIRFKTTTGVYISRKFVKQ